MGPYRQISDSRAALLLLSETRFPSRTAFGRFGGVGLFLVAYAHICLSDPSRVRGGQGIHRGCRGRGGGMLIVSAHSLQHFLQT